MIPNDHAIMLYKFGKHKWIRQLVDGNISFSCAGAFIFQAKRTKNTVQGDEYEGVFARLLASNPKTEEIRNSFGDDLQEIRDGEYIFFRRKSSRLMPIFCIYAYTAQDAINNAAPSKPGKKRIKVEFDPRLYEGFANSNIQKVLSSDNQFSLAFIQPKPFINRVHETLCDYGFAHEMHYVEYKDFNDGEFYIEPNENYPELFVKSKEYEYQHEARICITSKKFKYIFERENVNIGKLNEDDYELCNTPIHVEFNARFETTQYL